jgi:iron complex outermembrane receptor protein
MSAPARTYGAELELILEPSTHDRIGFNMSYTHGEFRDRDQQVVQGTGHTFDYYISSSSIPNIVPVQAQLSYDHDLKFAAGSALTFRAALRYKGAYEMAPVSQSSAEGGAYAYMHANSDLVGDLSANWTSSNEHFSVAAYVRNVGDHRNKAGGSIVDQGPGVFSATTLLTDPRTFGIVLSAKM